jgi:hypothetical protein
MNKGDDKAGYFALPALYGAIAFGLAVGSVAAMSLVVRSGPAVGDIISFDTSHPAPLQTEVRLLVHRPDQFACILDLNTIRQDGGSLVVEARIPGDTSGFQLHWAGGRTSTDSADCGRNADLIVDHHDVDVLALAAGGYGVGPKPQRTADSSIPF